MFPLATCWPLFSIGALLFLLSHPPSSVGLLLGSRDQALGTGFRMESPYILWGPRWLFEKARFLHRADRLKSRMFGSIR